MSYQGRLDRSIVETRIDQCLQKHNHSLSTGPTTTCRRHTLRRSSDIASIYSFLSNNSNSNSNSVTCSDDVTSESSSAYLSSLKSWVDKESCEQQSYSSSRNSPSVPQHYFIVLETTSSSSLSSSMDTPTNASSSIEGIALWCFGYSTWKGRFMNLELLNVPELCLEKVIMFALVDMAKDLDCKRLVWKTTNTDKVASDQTSYSAEFLNEWLTLSMDRDQMVQFSKTRNDKQLVRPQEKQQLHQQQQQPVQSSARSVIAGGVEESTNDAARMPPTVNSPPPHHPHHCSRISSKQPQTTTTTTLPTSTRVLHVIQECITSINKSMRLQQKTSSYEPYLQLRLAEERDTSSIVTLVRGLAVYEKAAEEVIVSAATYCRDLGGDSPLCYCLLLEVVTPTATTDEEKDDDKTSTTTTTVDIGYGFWYLGYTINSPSQYLYLEDLYITTEYRGRGGGTAIMYCLAEIALSLDCVDFQWQALDWNTPALDFYERMGASVKDGLLTLRLDQDGMDGFHMTTKG